MSGGGAVAVAVTSHSADVVCVCVCVCNALHRAKCVSPHRIIYPLILTRLHTHACAHIQTTLCGHIIQIILEPALARASMPACLPACACVCATLRRRLAWWWRRLFGRISSHGKCQTGLAAMQRRCGQHGRQRPGADVRAVTGIQQIEY